MESKPKGGTLAMQAAMLCRSEKFLQWLDGKRDAVHSPHTDETARAWLVAACKIESRAELDHDADAAAMFYKIAKAYRRDVGSTSPATTRKQREHAA